MSDIFSQNDLDFLVNSRSENCLSLFMPTAKAGPEVRQNPIRLKNLFAEAEALLSQRGTTSHLSGRMLNPLQALLPDTIYWANQSSGFAALCSPDFSRTYRLPMECRDFVGLADHFHLLPLIRFLRQDRKFYLLALSQNRARLLRCSMQEAEEIEPPDMPRSLEEALKYDDPHTQLQFHTGAPGTGGRRPALFHGQGVGIDETKDNVLRYSYLVNKGLESVLKNKKDPLILATVDYLFPIYRTANTYPFLIEDFVEGNPDNLSDQDLQKLAWPIVEKLRMDEEQRAISAFEEKAGTGFTSSNLKEVIPSAFQGRVDSLFIAAEAEQWGFVDEVSDGVILHEDRKAESCDLLNFAAVQTLRNGGSVYVLPQERVPDGLIAALYRY